MGACIACACACVCTGRMNMTSRHAGLMHDLRITRAHHSNVFCTAAFPVRCLRPTAGRAQRGPSDRVLARANPEARPPSLHHGSHFAVRECLTIRQTLVHVHVHVHGHQPPTQRCSRASPSPPARHAAPRQLRPTPNASASAGEPALHATVRGGRPAARLRGWVAGRILRARFGGSQTIVVAVARRERAT